MADLLKQSTVIRETLLKERVFSAHVSTVVVEKLTAAEVPMVAILLASTVIKETLIREAPIVVGTVIVEKLVDSDGDAGTNSHIIDALRQTVLMVRPAMVNPGLVRSAINVASYRETVLLERVMSRPFSGISAGAMRATVMLDRDVVLAPQVHSYTDVRTMRFLVVQSRSRVYAPVSMVYVAKQVSQVIAHRDTTPPALVRTAIRAFTNVQQVLQSRVRAAVVIMTYAYVPQLHMQVLVKDTRPAPISMIDVRSTRMLVMREHTMPPPGIDDRVAQFQQFALQRRDVTPPYGPPQAAGLRQQVMVERGAAVPLSVQSIKSTRMLAVMGRTTYPPQFALGRQAANMQQQVMQQRDQAGEQRSLTSVAQVRLQFTLERKVLPPIEVIDPGIGRHVFSLVGLAIQHRATTPPEQISTFSRFAFGVYSQVVHQDAFPPPPYPEKYEETRVYLAGQQVVHVDDGEWEPVTRVTARSVAGAVVLGDDADWVDPNVAQSALELFGIVSPLVVGGEVYPDPFAPNSDLTTVAVAQSAVVGDSTMPDPMLPQSDIDVRALIEFAAVGDAGWPDPTIPLSDVLAQRVASFLALRDPLLSGVVGGSEIASSSVVQFYVTRDPTMKGVALRSGPRPIISVTIS